MKKKPLQFLLRLPIAYESKIGFFYGKKIKKIKHRHQTTKGHFYASKIYIKKIC